MADDLIFLAEDILTSLFAQGNYVDQWGIFLDGAPVIVADSVISMEYRQDWSLSDYPVEQGGFETYNKVNSPFTVRIRFSCGGTELDRQIFLDSVNAAVDTLDLYDVVTPEAVYTSVNLSHYDYRRNSMNGVGLLVVDVWCTEVRVTATQEFTNTKSATANSKVNGGTVQPTAATSTQAASFNERFSTGAF